MSAERPRNIAEYLGRWAHQRADQKAIIVQRGGRFIRYGELAGRSDRLAAGLSGLGLGRGDRCVVMIKPGIDFFIVAFALFKLGAVLVAADPGLGLRRLGDSLARVRPEAFIGIARAHALRWLCGGRWDSLRHRIVVGGASLLPGHTSLRSIDAPVLEGGLAGVEAGTDMAAILFTSGSTGAPKGVVYSHDNFIAQVEQLRARYAIEPGEVDLATFPLFGLFAPALGMTVVVPDMNAAHPGRARPQRILAAIRDHKVSTMFGSPALLRRVAGYAPGRRYAPLPTLQRVLAAGAPISAEVLRDFGRLLAPNVPIHIPYGATEALPVSSISSAEVFREGLDEATRQGQGVCVGRPLAGVDVRIVPISDATLAEWSDELSRPVGEIGEIVVRGAQVTQAYFRDEEQTRLAKISRRDGGFYHRMGDLGYLDEQGRLWFCGRKSQRVALPGQLLCTVNCEGVFNAHPQVARSALVAVMRGGSTLPALCVELEPAARRAGARHASLFQELQALGARHAHTRVIEDFLVHPGFPVDIRHNAKIGREALAVWAGRRLSRRPP